MRPDHAENTELLHRAGQGDAAAREQLLGRHRDRLRKMIAVRLDRRLLSRVDPSDVVQDVLTEAHGRLARYLAERPLDFYPWLRQIAEERLVYLFRRHVQAQKRSVSREECRVLALPDESLLELAGRLIGSGSTPSERIQQEELRQQMRQALLNLGERDREVLVLRYLEGLS